MDKKMYAINPIVKLPQSLSLSNVMHNVNAQFALPDNVKDTYYENAKPHLCQKESMKSENGSELIVRQEKILETLMKIKEKLINLQQDQSLTVPFITSSTKATSKTQSSDVDLKSLKSGVIQDVVVCSDSSHPPYFLLALKNILAPHLKICLSSTIHSSSAQVDKNIFNLFQDENLEDRSSFDVAFTVIWKNQKFKSLMVNPLTQCTIIGEGNILRYLSRLPSNLSSLNYEFGDLSEVAEVDYWLDLIQIKLLHGNNKEQQNVLKQLNSKLGSSEWLNGRQFGVCDIFLWSALKQLDLLVSSAIPSNVASWVKKITKIAEFNVGESSKI